MGTLVFKLDRALALYFVLDSGAADVQIPADVALTLYRTGTIRDTDFLPGKTYVLADGSPVQSARFLLRSLTVGRQRIANVPASIGSLSSTPLLGQSFLARLGAWRVDNQREVLVVQSRASSAKSAQLAESTVPELGGTPSHAEARQALVVSPLRLSSQVAQVGQRLTVQLEATNTSTRAGRGVIMVNYPGHLVSLMALHTTGQETIGQFPTSNVEPPAPDAPANTTDRLLWSHWPVWAPGERRTAVIALVPRLAQDITFHVSVVFDVTSTPTVSQRWSAVVRIPCQTAEKR